MFAIRQVSTGFWLPPYNGRAGGTHSEPKKDAIPRIFRRRQDAEASLGWWLGGKVRARYNFEGEVSDLITTKVPSRTPEDMEVVQISVVLV